MGSNKGQPSNNRQLSSDVVKAIRKLKERGMSAPGIVKLFEGVGIEVRKHHVWNIDEYYKDIE